MKGFQNDYQAKIFTSILLCLKVPSQRNFEAFLDQLNRVLVLFSENTVQLKRVLHSSFSLRINGVVCMNLIFLKLVQNLQSMI